MTIGNIPKDIRRKPSQHAYVLLGYLPTTRLEHIKNKAARRRTVGNLFHTCMAGILEPLKTAGKEGHPMASGDGVVRRIHPIYACFVADYPEQVLAVGVKTGECPVCTVHRDELEEFNVSGDNPFRDIGKILDALDVLDKSKDYSNFAHTCADLSVKPLAEPFWKGLPFTNIYQAITPDVLHQLYQGVFKHLLSWIKTAFGEDEIDSRCRRLPRNHNVRHFFNGIGCLSRISGKEHDQISRIILGLIIDIPLPGGQSPDRLICAVRAILDFIHLAQYPVHTTDTLQSLHDSLQQFHDNKDIFIDLEIRTTFNLPKLHFSKHYAHLITLFGTTDNYNTEYTERLHIELAKDAYRATNHKDEYPQMTLWLERREKVQRHAKYIKWRLEPPIPASQAKFHPRLIFPRETQMTKHPSLKAIPISTIIDDYGAKFFREALVQYAVMTDNPDATRGEIEDRLESFTLPIAKFPIFHRIKFIGARRFQSETKTIDSVHIQPSRKDKRNQTVVGRFDTVLVSNGQIDSIGIKGTLPFWPQNVNH
jgi:hypothetical protein